MRTLGIDLSARPPRTACALIEWQLGRAVVQRPYQACDDERLLKLLCALGEGDRAGVDCPFGWPAAFSTAVAAHAAPQPSWPGRDIDGAQDLRALRYRRTDTMVARTAPRPPLSVSFDKLGAVAARWARLQALLASRGRVVDRTGAGTMAEVYPAAARHRWGLTSGTLGELLAAAPWLRLETGAEEEFAGSQDAYDALLSALVARAVACGLTTWPNSPDAALARSEGWIHLPHPNSLHQLLA